MIEHFANGFYTIDVQACLKLCMRCPVIDQCAKERRPVGISGGIVWTAPSAGKPRQVTARKCKWCRNPFFGERKGAAFCSTACSWEAVKHYERILGHETYQALRDRAKAGVGAKYPESFWRERVAALELELAQVGLGVYEQTPKEPA